MRKMAVLRGILKVLVVSKYDLNNKIRELMMKFKTSTGIFQVFIVLIFALATRHGKIL